MSGHLPLEQTGERLRSQGLCSAAMSPCGNSKTGEMIAPGCPYAIRAPSTLRRTWLESIHAHPPLALALLLSGCSSGNQHGTTETAHARQEGESARLTSYLDAAYETELATSPEHLTSQGRKEQYDKLDDRSEAALDRTLEWRRKSVADMKSMFDYNLLTDDAKTSYDIWAQELDRAERRKAFRRHTYIFTPGDDHTGLPQFLINFHRVDDKRDMEAYISRLSLLDDALDQLLVRARAAAADGIRPPAFAFAQVIDEVKRVTTGAPFTRGPDAALFADAKAKIASLAKDNKITKEEATSAYRRGVEGVDDGGEAGVRAGRRLARSRQKERVERRPRCGHASRRRELLHGRTLPADDDHDDRGRNPRARPGRGRAPSRRDGSRQGQGRVQGHAGRVLQVHAQRPAVLLSEHGSRTRRAISRSRRNISATCRRSCRSTSACFRRRG